MSIARRSLQNIKEHIAFCDAIGMQRPATYYVQGIEHHLSYTTTHIIVHLHPPFDTDLHGNDVSAFTIEHNQGKD